MRLFRRQASPAIRCPYCRADLEGDLVECGGCSTSYHAECAAEHPTCCVLGCEGALAPRSPQAELRELEGAPDWRQRATTCVGCKDSVAPRDRLPCGACRAVHHRECLRRAGACEACAHPHTRLAATLERPPLSRGEAWVLLGLLGGGGLILALVTEGQLAGIGVMVVVAALFAAFQELTRSR